MKVLVTGAAGFIGSKVSELCLNAGHQVVGVDALLDDLYSNSDKERRVARLIDDPNFTFVTGDLRTMPLAPLVDGMDVVVHEAAMPGLSLSWERFDTYVTCNLVATERLLRALTKNPDAHLIHASTSSVYGVNAVGDETSDLRPVSPYGVTKLAAENLVEAYRVNWGVKATILRYFSIYGPSQRPDMAYERFCKKLASREPITITGDGHQSRTNTHIDDVARATVLAAEARLDGEILNICGDQEMNLLDVIGIFADEIGVEPELVFTDPRPGDQYRTRGNAGRAQASLGWQPEIPLEEGLRGQAKDVLTRMD